MRKQKELTIIFKKTKRKIKKVVAVGMGSIRMKMSKTIKKKEKKRNIYSPLKVINTTIFFFFCYRSFIFSSNIKAARYSARG